MWSIFPLMFSLSYYSPLTKLSHPITIEEPSVWLGQIMTYFSINGVDIEEEEVGLSMVLSR